MLSALAVSAALSGCTGSSPTPASNADAPPSQSDRALRTDCEDSVEPASFASREDLWEFEKKLDSYGLRATGNPAHQAYVSWLQSKLEAIPGLELQTSDYPIRRWTETAASLEIGDSMAFTLPLPISGVVPYSLATPAAGVGAPLVYLPAGTDITAENAAGKIVLRDVDITGQANAALAAVAWWIYDPDLSFARQLTGSMNNAQGVTGKDMEAAQTANAAGLIFLHDFPRQQVLDLYRPYDGVHWMIPALQVGSDEAAQLRDLAANGGYARLKISALDEPATTRMLVATLPGTADDALVIESHTDGTSALWDNGPLAMLAMARYFGQFDASCRARTLKFVFTTAHLYQELMPPWRSGSANLYAQQMDRDYAAGKATAAIVIEHLGARKYAAIPRSDGGPGQELSLTDQHELNTYFVTESPGLLSSLLLQVQKHQLGESLALRGTGLPGAHLPLSNNFGGEGNPYVQHLLPTLAFITAPLTLFTPGYSLEGIDPELLHAQTLMFADLIQSLSQLPRELIAGAATAERLQRDLLCATGLDIAIDVLCEGTPSAPETAP
ncbi:MAG: hypothetical protein Q8Q73_07710 [Stagnimonas sp.]|nr:hypothetical protein [Stagnimonas sp.]